MLGSLKNIVQEELKSHLTEGYPLWLQTGKNFQPVKPLYVGDLQKLVTVEL